jgi:iron complex transport system ATP-binding protein
MKPGTTRSGTTRSGTTRSGTTRSGTTRSGTTKSVGEVVHLSMQDVHVELGGHPVVRGVTLDIPRGRVVGLVGPNGCGKSTLLRAAYRARRPTRGRVLLGDRDVYEMPRRELARELAVMTQEQASEFDLDVVDVVMLGRLPHHSGLGADTARDFDLVEQSLHRVGAEHLATRMFAGLSGGEKQRVLLARCLAQQPSTLVLDEPTNHLDIAFQHELLSLVRQLGHTTAVALHDLNLAMTYCDVVAVMQQGRLVATGPPADVLTSELIREVFGVQADLVPHARVGGHVLAFSGATPPRPQPSPDPRRDAAAAAAASPQCNGRIPITVPHSTSDERTP